MLPPTRFQITVSCLSIDCVRGLNEMREMLNTVRYIHGAHMDERENSNTHLLDPFSMCPYFFVSLIRVLED